MAPCQKAPSRHRSLQQMGRQRGGQKCASHGAECHGHVCPHAGERRSVRCAKRAGLFHYGKPWTRGNMRSSRAAVDAIPDSVFRQPPGRASRKMARDDKILQKLECMIMASPSSCSPARKIRFRSGAPLLRRASKKREFIAIDKLGDIFGMRFVFSKTKEGAIPPGADGAAVVEKMATEAARRMEQVLLQHAVPATAEAMEAFTIVEPKKDYISPFLSPMAISAMQYQDSGIPASPRNRRASKRSPSRFRRKPSRCSITPSLATLSMAVTSSNVSKTRRRAGRCRRHIQKEEKAGAQEVAQRKPVPDEIELNRREKRLTMLKNAHARLEDACTCRSPRRTARPSCFRSHRKIRCAQSTAKPSISQKYGSDNQALTLWTTFISPRSPFDAPIFFKNFETIVMNSAQTGIKKRKRSGASGAGRLKISKPP